MSPNLRDEESIILTPKTTFYEDSKKLLVIIVCLMVLVIGLLGFFVYLQLNKVPEPKFFRTTAANQLIKPTALDKAHFPENVILNWVTAIVTRGYSFNFSNMERIILSLESHFTRRGFDSYLDAIGKTGNRKWVVQEKLIASATPLEAPVITREGIVDGRYGWSVKLPLRVVYSGVNLSRVRRVIVKILVIRVKTTEDAPDGMKIFNLSAEGEGGRYRDA